MKKEKTIKQLEKRLKIVKIFLLISYVCFFTMFILFSLSVFMNYKITNILKDRNIIPQSYEIPKNISNITINFTDLSESERKIAQNLINSMKDIYLLPQKSITFSHNISEFYGNGYESTTIAFNQNKGDIYILWRNDMTAVAVSICHETLHTVIINNEISHKIIYDVADYLTCFEETKDGN